MLRRIAVFVAVLALVGVAAWFSPASAHSYHHHHHHHHRHHRHGGHSSSSSDNSSGDSGSTDGGGTTDDSTAGDGSGSTTSDDGGSSKADSGATDAAPTATATPLMKGAIATGAKQSIQVETTGYSNSDNQGGNNAKISAGVIHKEASGDGTYANPTTLAVPGHGGSGMQTPKGTRVYFEKYHFYGLVEDSGATPKKLKRFDIWTDGRGNSSAKSCMDELTGTSSAILNPPPGEPVTYSGPRSDSKGCHAS